MSIVGTRPPTLDEWNKYELHHRARLAIKPGITGMWQVSGRSEITDLDKVPAFRTLDYMLSYRFTYIASMIQNMGISLIPKMTNKTYLCNCTRLRFFADYPE